MRYQIHYRKANKELGNPSVFFAGFIVGAFCATLGALIGLFCA